MFWDVLRDIGLFWGVVGLLGGLAVVVGVALERREEPAEAKVADAEEWARSIQELMEEGGDVQ